MDQESFEPNYGKTDLTADLKLNLSPVFYFYVFWQWKTVWLRFTTGTFRQLFWRPPVPPGRRNFHAIQPCRLLPPDSHRCPARPQGRHALCRRSATQWRPDVDLTNGRNDVVLNLRITYLGNFGCSANCNDLMARTISVPNCLKVVGQIWDIQ